MAQIISNLRAQCNHLSNLRIGKHGLFHSALLATTLCKFSFALLYVILHLEGGNPMKYSNEEKLSIVARYQQGERITALSNELAISRSTLYRWLKSFPSDSIGKPLKFSYQEYASLQRKVEKLQNIITILKSADCLVSAPLKERLHALEPFYGKYEVHTICEALDIDRGTFYNHILRSKRGNA